MNAKEMIHAIVYAQNLGMYSAAEALYKANWAVEQYVPMSEIVKEVEGGQLHLNLKDGSTTLVANEPAPIPDEVFEPVVAVPEAPVKRGPGRPRKQ